MNLSTAVLGSTAVKRLEGASREYVLSIGKDHLTRQELAGVGCFNFIAARNLSHLLTDLGVTNLRDLYERIAPADLVLPQLGVISLAVLGAAFEAVGIGGENPLESWVRKHSEKLRTFDSLKHAQHREQQAAAAEKKTAKRRKAARQRQAHEIRVDRFTKRQQAAAS
jgi:hypothetical protein